VAAGPLIIMRIGQWFLTRTLELIPTLFGVALVSFIVVRSIPGDPAIILLGHQYTPELYRQARIALGLDQPIYIQYFYYLRLLILGDWGKSFLTSAPVLPLVLEAFFNTLMLTVTAMLMASIAGLALGIVAATHHGSKLDTVLSRGIGISGMSFPAFWVALMFILIFSVYLHLLPAVGGGSIENLILPSASLAVYALGLISRVTRSAILDVMTQDYAITAVAKGLKSHRILFGHILRNAWVPIVTITGLQFGALVSGAVVTETVFGYPGLGLLLVGSVFRRDYPVIEGCIVIAGVAIALINLCVDYLYVFLDPRLRHD
jgi:peptide/nickel transport system permease protein